MKSTKRFSAPGRAKHVRWLRLEPNSASGCKKCGPFKKDLVVKPRKLDAAAQAAHIAAASGEHDPLKTDEDDEKTVSGTI